MDQICKLIEYMTPELEDYYHQAVRVFLVGGPSSPNADMVIHAMLHDPELMPPDVQTLVLALALVSGEELIPGELRYFQDARPDLLAKVSQ